MNKSISIATLAFACMAAAGSANAQSATQVPAGKTIQVAAVRTEQPVMSYEVASLIQFMHKAQAQHRRTGQAQDLARVEAVRRELTSRGFGRSTQSAPVMMAQSGSMLDADRSVRVSLAD